MRRKFLVNIVFLLTVSVLVKAFWVLGIDRTVQNVVGETAYGSYFSLFSFSVLFTLLLDMGLSGFNNRAVSADPIKGEDSISETCCSFGCFLQQPIFS
ncbi:MAG: hypothetical protein MZV63_50355 [Marinilabiliales bacterium]|nr:hypothetical protein [Marinilabiliales bacterium]